MDNKGNIHSDKSKTGSIDHRIADKTKLSERTNTGGLANKIDKHISDAKTGKPDNISGKITSNRIQQARPAPSKKYRLSAPPASTKIQHAVVSSKPAIKQKPHKLQKAVKFDRSRLHFRRITTEKLKKIRLSKKKYSLSGNNAKTSVRTSETSGVMSAVGKSAGKAALKPVSSVGNKLLSQRADFSDTDNTGTETIKLGLQTTDYLRKGTRKLQTAIEKPRKIYKSIKRTVNSGGSRTLKTSVKAAKTTGRTLKTSAKAAKTSAKAAKASAKAAAKTAQAAAKATAKAAQAMAKAAAQVAKATVQGVAKAVNLIVETFPYSLIVILAILLILVIVFVIGSATSSVGGAGTAAGGWAASDDTYNTPEEMYGNIEKFIDESAKSIKDNIKDPLYYDNIKPFCDDDTSKPRRIIEYMSESPKDNIYFPARGKDTTIKGFIDNFDLEFYPDFLATLFVLMTRDKQNAEGVSDTEIYDFDFKREDFDEFLGQVNINSCKYGPTFVYKKTETISGCACPGENCEKKTKPGCKCAYKTDKDGKKIYFCAGHPYCPHTHTKLVVKLYTIQEYTKKSIPDIYGFSDNEKTRYQATKEFIQEMYNSYGGDETGD